jgi:hypothetical protein
MCSFRMPNYLRSNRIIDLGIVHVHESRGIFHSQNILTCQSLILRYFRSGAESRFRGEILPRHENSTLSRRAVQLVGLHLSMHIFTLFFKHRIRLKPPGLFREITTTLS